LGSRGAGILPGRRSRLLLTQDLGREAAHKVLEDENRRLKKLLAESMLDNAALKALPEKNV